jgi:hypothetical protein
MPLLPLDKNEWPKLPCNSPEHRVALCLKKNLGVDVVARQFYPIVEDRQARAKGFLRVIDGSGEDYLYPVAILSNFA